MKNKERVAVFIPRRNKYDTERYVSVNGQNMLVQTGRQVMVPKPFASVINRSIRSDESADTFIAAMANKG